MYGQVNYISNESYNRVHVFEEQYLLKMPDDRLQNEI